MFDDQSVRTTLDLDDDVLAAARSIAAARKQTMGKELRIANFELRNY